MTVLVGAIEAVEWLAGIAAQLQQPDGHICAHYHPAERHGDMAQPEEWRLIAYFGDSWEMTGDGWRSVELTGDDPISKRDEAAVEALWRAAIGDARIDHERQKAAAQ